MEYLDVRNWIMTECSSSEMNRIREDLKARQNILASSISIGDSIRTMNLSPKYLNGLTGILFHKATRRGKVRGDIMLDEASTAILRAKNSAIYVRPEAQEYLLTGISMVCFEIIK